MLINFLSLNVTKIIYPFFHKTSKKDDIPLKLPKLQINNYIIERILSIKFLGILLDELDEKTIFHENTISNIYTESKIFKNIGILYKASTVAH